MRYVLVDQHVSRTGKIWVTSVPGKGSRFCFTLRVFSLASLVRPILAEQEKPGNSLALFEVQIEARDGSPDVPRKDLNVVRMVVQKCLPADTAVLLPSIGPDEEHKLFFVVANTEQRGAEIIGNRIRGQLDNHQEFQSDNLTVSVSHFFLPPMSPEANESTEAFAERAAVEVRGQINNAVCLQGAR